MLKKISILTLIVILAAFNFSIYQKELIKKSDDTVLLELRPLDPRSIMQGDYMRLGYKIEPRQPNQDKTVGYIVIEKGEHNIASFVDFYNGQALTANQKLIKYYPSHNFIEIHPNSFMFQEGKAELYEQAKYALFKYNGSKDYLLDSLLTEKFEKIF